MTDNNELNPNFSALKTNQKNHVNSPTNTDSLLNSTPHRKNSLKEALLPTKFQSPPSTTDEAPYPPSLDVSSDSSTSSSPSPSPKQPTTKQGIQIKDSDAIPTASINIISNDDIVADHQSSTQSQLKVAITNFELAANKLGIADNNVTTATGMLRTHWEQKIEKAYKNAKPEDLSKINKQFRKKKNDFNMKASLTRLLNGDKDITKPTRFETVKQAMFNGVARFVYEFEIPLLNKAPLIKYPLRLIGQLWKPTLGKLLKFIHKPAYQRIQHALKSTKPLAIDAIAGRAIQSNVNSAPHIPHTNDVYSGTIQGHTTQILHHNDIPFVSSASNRSNPNNAGSCFIQTLTKQDTPDSIEFATVRHSALTVKNSDDVLEELSVNPTVSLYIATTNNPLNTASIQQIITGNNIPQKNNLLELVKLSENTNPKPNVVARRLALLNKAIDVAKSATVIHNKNNPYPDTPLNITSISLMTPVKGTAEFNYFKDQQMAFTLLKKLPNKVKKDLGLPTTIQVHAFNFGVNEGEGAGQQNKDNDTALKDLKTNYSKWKNNQVPPLEDENGAEVIVNDDEPPTVTIHTNSTLEKADKLWQEIDELNTKLKKERSNVAWSWHGNAAYELAAKIALFTQLIGGVNACNCKSGKDRTGMHIQNTLYEATQRNNNHSDSPSKIEAQKNRREWLLKSGQLEIQKLNTGSPGYKLVDNVLSTLHKGKIVGSGQRPTTWFMDRFGMTKEEVKQYLNMQAKFNAT